MATTTSGGEPDPKPIQRAQTPEPAPLSRVKSAENGAGTRSGKKSKPTPKTPNGTKTTSSSTKGSNKSSKNTKKRVKRSSEIIKTTAMKEKEKEIEKQKESKNETNATNPSTPTKPTNSRLTQKRVSFKDTIIIKEPTHIFSGTLSHSASDIDTDITDITDIESVDGNSDDERQDKIAPLRSLSSARRPQSARNARRKLANRSRRRHSANAIKTGITQADIDNNAASNDTSNNASNTTPGAASSNSSETSTASTVRRPNLQSRKGRKLASKRRASVSATTRIRRGSNNSLTVPTKRLSQGSRLRDIAKKVHNGEITPQTPDTPGTPETPQTPATPLTPGNNATETPKTAKNAKNAKSPSTPNMPETLEKRLETLQLNRSNRSVTKPLSSRSTTNSRSTTPRGGRRRNSTRTAREMEDNDALIARLRKQNQDLKSRVSNIKKEMSQVKIQNLRNEREKDKILNKHGQVDRQDYESMEKQVSKLKKELKETRHERDELRRLHKESEIHLNEAKNKLDMLEKSSNNDELLAQLQRLKKDAKVARKEKKELLDETLKLKNIDANLRAKLAKLTKKLMDIEGVSNKYVKEIYNATNMDNMLNVLIDQLTDITVKYEMLLKRFDVKMTQCVNDKTNDLQITINAKTEIIESLKIKLVETQELYDNNKKLEEDYNKTKEELKVIKEDREQLMIKLSQTQEKNEHFERQMQILTKMPVANNLNKQVARLKKIFEKMDANKDGKLDFEEFASGCEELGFGSLEYEKRASFEGMDKNGDGFVEFNDFQDACLQILYSQSNKFKNISDSQWSEMRKLLIKPPTKWSNEDVMHWLEHIGMDMYSNAFENGTVNGKKLLNSSNFNSDDLKTFANQMEHYSITKKGHIRKLFKELNDIKKRDDIINNIKFENNRLLNEIDDLKEEMKHGPSWQNVKSLQTRVRGLEGQLRRERHLREQIMNRVKDELKYDPRFDSLEINEEDLVAELVLLKGALADANDKVKKLREKLRIIDSNEIDARDNADVGERMKDSMDHSEFEVISNSESEIKQPQQPIGRFLQKWYVMANHNTQYWVSRTNKEMIEQSKLLEKETIDIEKHRTNNNSTEMSLNSRRNSISSTLRRIHNHMSTSSHGGATTAAGAGAGSVGIGVGSAHRLEEEVEMSERFGNKINETTGASLERTEALNWILYDCKKDRIINEVRMKGRGMNNDPKNVKIQMSVSKCGPWTTVQDAQLKRSTEEQVINGFKVKSRFWRVCLMTNHGEDDPDAPRFVMHQVQFWGPLDEDVENEHFVIE